MWYLDLDLRNCVLSAYWRQIPKTFKKLLILYIHTKWAHEKCNHEIAFNQQKRVRFLNPQKIFSFCICTKEAHEKCVRWTPLYLCYLHARNKKFVNSPFNIINCCCIFCQSVIKNFQPALLLLCMKLYLQQPMGVRFRKPSKSSSWNCTFNNYSHVPVNSVTLIVVEKD